MTDWVRLWHDLPTDPKWRTIARKSGQRVGDVIAVFNFLMVNASANAEARGSIAGFDPEDVATALDLDDTDVLAILSAMQGKVLDGERLTGWEKRQPKREDGTAAERKAAWKEREAEKRNAAERNGTLGNAPETDAETELETEKEHNNGFQFSGRVIRLNKTDFTRWQRSFAALDLPALLQSRDDWLADRPEPERKKWFQSTSNWLSSKQQEAKTRAKADEMASPC